jgi:integrase
MTTRVAEPFSKINAACLPGAYPMPKLTKRTIDATHPKAIGDVFIWDDELPAYGLRVKPSGTKSFILQYRNRAGRSRRLTLGRYGVLTADAARDLARDALAEVAKGGDPAERRAADRDALTVADLCRRYLDEAERGLILTRKGKAKKPSTLYTDRIRAERHVVPLIGHRTVRDLTAADLRAFVRDVISGRSAAGVQTRGRAVTGGKGTATRTMAFLATVLAYAVHEGYRADNPARGIVLPAYEKRKVRLDAAQYAALGRALKAAEARGEPWQAVEAVRLLALTGARAGEIGNLKRSECDLRNSLLALADSKTGASLRPLGKAALEVLRAVLARSNGPYVFPALRIPGGPYKGPQAWVRIRDAKAENGDLAEPSLASLTPHGLRHSFASVADDLGMSEPTIAALLGHAGGSVTRGYIHKLDGALLGAADKVAGFIADAMAGFADSGAEVIDLASAQRASAM